MKRLPRQNKQQINYSQLQMVGNSSHDLIKALWFYDWSLCRSVVQQHDGGGWLALALALAFERQPQILHQKSGFLKTGFESV